MIHDIFDYLRDKYPYWGWMGQRAHDASAINKVMPLDFILSCDYGTDVQYCFNEENLFSVEKKESLRKGWSNEDLKSSLKGELGEMFFSRINKFTQTVNIICYRSIKDLEDNGSSHKYRILAPSEDIKRYFDNKILLHNMLPELGIERIPGREGFVGRQSYRDLSEELSVPFVVRFPYGSSGQFTFIITGANDYDQIIEKHSDHHAIFEKFIGGFSLNVNAVIVDTDEGVYVSCSFPSVQITGVPQCSNFSSSFCGNDFSSGCDLDKDILHEVERITTIIGQWMGSKGFRGVFGMDLMVSSENKVYPLEINPRFQNSTALFDTINVVSGREKNMLFLLHVLQFLQHEDKEIKAYIKKYPFEDLMLPLSGAQVILHNKAGRVQVKRSILPGVYRYDDAGLKKHRFQAVLSQRETEKDVLITCAVPKKDLIVEHNSSLCKIQLLKKVLDPYNKVGLNDEVSRLVGEIYSSFIFETIGEEEPVSV